MHLKDFNYNTDPYFFSIFEKLKMHVPEFSSLAEKDETYQILFDFATFITENMDNDTIVRESSNFINEAIAQGNRFTIEAIILQVFQPLYNHDEKLFNKIKMYFSPASQKLYLENLKLWQPKYKKRRKGHN